ncbi:hypothetical protein ACSNOI_41215 [Actinomadura kijaniata]|uniref:hypothetical protein n=1 Tax=Actinomadura kijaniata TaxID=46161 RepID=UPI003F1D36C5
MTPGLRVEMVHTALTVLLGLGGAFALVVNTQRQRLEEQTHVHAERTHVINQARQGPLHARQAARKA